LRRAAIGRLALIAAVGFASEAGAVAVEAANASGAFGLYPAPSFRLVTGGCKDCATLRQALWYFRAETIAVPKPGLPVASFAPGVSAFDDIRAWAATRSPGAAIDYPPLVWVESPQVVRGARLSADGTRLEIGSAGLAVKPEPKIPLNRSYYNAASIAYLQDRALTVRGTLDGGELTMRTVWPEAFALGGTAPQTHALPAASSPGLALRALMRDSPRGGAQGEFVARTLWQRDAAASDWSGKPVLALMVNGAQGDDDEAHAGHFAIVTGRVAPDGRLGDWLVNNYYSLDVESEKGIIAAPLPLDNYLADLNSGQNWYRPTYMVVLVLRDARAADLVQSALNRVYNQFYRHQLVYYHPSDNCASISVDTLRALGWPIPARGASNRLLAWISFPVVAIKERSLGKAKVAFDYLYTDPTRLLPAVALEEAFDSILTLVRGELPEGSGPLARMIAEDVAAIAYVRVPQFPSNRAFGDAPAVSVAEYKSRVPDDPALAQIVPVPPRPFPEALRDPDLLEHEWRPSDYATLVWGVLSIVGIPVLLWRAWVWRKRRRSNH